MNTKKDLDNSIQKDKVIGSTIARIFSASVFNQLASQGNSSILNSIIKELNFKATNFSTLSELFEHSYQKLLKGYRNEYLYKNSIANKILLGKYSLNTAAMLSEFRVGSSKADTLILNGTSYIYEIKTELDSLDRLEQQLINYQSFAEYVSVVTDKKHILKLLTKVPTNIGIIEFTDRNTLRTIKEPASNMNCLNVGVIFDSLRQNEYTQIIQDYYGFIPEVPNTLLYKHCKELFQDIPIQIVHGNVLKELKKRQASELNKEFIKSVPSSLKASAISNQLTKKQINNLSSALVNGIL
jgi:hypothetical protein